jgi:cell division septation protein DedD
VYTYNHPDEAQKKSAAITQKHPELHPAVFTPSGHAPYLVTIGGVMNRDAAFALARKSRSAGLPRDTYAQNY